jgi:tellurite resistance protein TerC
MLKSLMDAFRFLKVGLGLVLVFVGAKMCVEKWVHIPAEISLLVVVGLLGGSVAASLLWPEKPGRNGESGESVVIAEGGDGTEEIGDGKMNPR